MLEEHHCLILTCWHVLKLKYRVHARNYKLTLQGIESLKPDDIETFNVSNSYKNIQA